MANPFDQFDNSPVAPAQPVVIKPGENPEAVIAAAAPAQPEVDASNPFNNPNPTRKLSPDEFSAEFYNRLNNGDSVESLLQWSKDVGSPIKADENFYENVRIRDEALRNKQPGKYGRVNRLKANEQQSTDVLGGLGAFARQGGNTALFNFGDEIDAALRAVPELVTGGNAGQAYEDRWNALQTRNDLDWALHPGMSTAGTLTGAALGARATPSAFNIDSVRDANLAIRTGVGIAEGAGMGALAATGEGTPDNRFGNTGTGAVIGGGIGGAVSPAIAAIGRIGRPIIERLRPDEAKALARRLNYSPQQIEAAEAELARQRGLGINDSTLLDVIDEPGRSVVGSAGAHDAARGDLQNFASARTTQLPERVGAAAEEIVAPPNSAELGLADDVRSGLQTQRNAEIEAAMDAEISPGMRLRDTPLDITPEIADVLGTTLGQRAIREVINETVDAGLRDQLAALQGAARTRARSTDPRLPEAAQQAAQNSMMQDMPFSIDISERLSRKLNELGRTSGNRALFSFARTVREGANSSPRFREIMSRYGDLSDAANAVGVGSGVSSVMDEAGEVTKAANEGAGFLAEPASRFETRVDELSGVPLTDAEGAVVTTPSGGTVSERDLARLGASEQVATRAGAGPGEAGNVAKQLYDSPEQRARSVALLGEAGADRLAARMREEVERVYRATRQASKEGPASERGMAAVESGVNTLYNPGPVSAIRESARFLHRIGLSERDALWIVRNATDPAQTQAILNRLRQAGVDETRARAYTEQLRNAGARYFTGNEEN